MSPRLVLRWVTITGFSSRCQTFISVLTSHPRPTQPSIPPESVNKDQLRLGRKRQVWFIPLADERGVWDFLRTRAIPECLRGVFMMRCYTNSRLHYHWIFVGTIATTLYSDITECLPNAVSNDCGSIAKLVQFNWQNEWFCDISAVSCPATVESAVIK